MPEAMAPEDRDIQPASRIGLEFGALALRAADPLPPLLELMAGLPGLTERRQELFVILSELFYNALDHGLLGIDSSIKDQEDGFERFYRLRESRRARLTEGSIRLDVEVRAEPNGSGGEVRICVEDSGPGFDLERELPRFEQNLGAAGRGIPLVRSLCREMRFVPPGNRVEVVYAW
ncbi:MAG: ATP-binding protein [Gemmatimonadetes bacterium]|nr:ATP-binding protein [Gemmatimonadota bacterium]